MQIVTGTVVAFLGLLGLFLASRSLDSAIYVFGLLLFVFAVLFVFYLIAASFEKRTVPD